MQLKDKSNSFTKNNATLHDKLNDICRYQAKTLLINLMNLLAYYDVEAA